VTKYDNVGVAMGTCPYAFIGIQPIQAKKLNGHSTKYRSPDEARRAKKKIQRILGSERNKVRRISQKGSGLTEAIAALIPPLTG